MPMDCSLIKFSLDFLPGRCHLLAHVLLNRGGGGLFCCINHFDWYAIGRRLCPFCCWGLSLFRGFLTSFNLADLEGWICAWGLLVVDSVLSAEAPSWSDFRFLVAAKAIWNLDGAIALESVYLYSVSDFDRLKTETCSPSESVGSSTKWSRCLEVGLSGSGSGAPLTLEEEDLEGGYIQWSTLVSSTYLLCVNFLTTTNTIRKQIKLPSLTIIAF